MNFWRAFWCLFSKNNKSYFLIDFLSLPESSQVLPSCNFFVLFWVTFLSKFAWSKYLIDFPSSLWIKHCHFRVHLIILRFFGAFGVASFFKICLKWVFFKLCPTSIQTSMEYLYWPFYDLFCQIKRKYSLNGYFPYKSMCCQYGLS